MEMLNPCCCCLLRSADKDMNTPYVYLGATEIFSDMLDECFQLHFAVGLDDCGICEVCVGRLRDASDFKLQVQRSQAELQERVERGMGIKEEDKDELKPKTSLEVYIDNAEEDVMPDTEPTVKSETDDEGKYITCAEQGSGSLRFREQHAMAGSVRPERLQHKDQFSLTTSDTKDFAPKTDTSMKDSVNNKLCFKQFRGENSLVNDERYDKPKKLNIPCKPIQRVTLTCDVCNRQFERKFNLIQHMTVHTGYKSYTCEICDTKFSHSSSLKRHRQTHTGQKLYTCDVCDQRFALKGVLIRHIRVHTGDKPYTCEVCSKKFTQSASYKRHIIMHSGQKPYTCSICSKQFTRKSNLTVHSRVHTGEQPYFCEVCSKRFSDFSTLKRHKQTHIQVERLYKCETCEKRFASKTALNRHNKTHTRDKP